MSGLRTRFERRSTNVLRSKTLTRTEEGHNVLNKSRLQELSIKRLFIDTCSAHKLVTFSFLPIAQSLRKFRFAHYSLPWLLVSIYEPHRSAGQLAAQLSFGIIKGHPFLDGNKRTAFFLSNEYIRAMGIPGLADAGKVGDVYKSISDIAQRHIDVAAGKLDVEGLAKEG
ncbi:hypothetical protein H0H92_003593 [Tricholoma furcatifolium]|nr:hypothetical protein H0H92_003593 [Tricholoma furcatifolium]